MITRATFFPPIHRCLAGAIPLLLLLLLVTACAGPKVASEKYYTWPPPPNYPRVQYLTGVSNSGDVLNKKESLNIIGGLAGAKETVLPILKPYGIAHRKGVLYVVDSSGSRVSIIDIPRGTFSFLKGNAGMGRLKKPVNIAVDDDGFIYVADTDRREIVSYTPTGDFAGSFCRDLDIKPVAVAVFEDNLYVLDFQKSEVVVINKKDGNKITSFGKDDANPKNSLALPTNIFIDSKGILYITNTGTGATSVMDRDGHFLRSFGQMGTNVGFAARPRGITVDKDGQIYIVDGGHQTAQIFNNEGRLLMNFGSINTPVGAMNLPAGIAVFDTDLEYYQQFAQPGFKLERVIAVTNQNSVVVNGVAASHKVAIYGFGKLANLDYDKEYKVIRERLERQAQEAREQQRKLEEETKKKEEEARKQEEVEKLKDLERLKQEEAADKARQSTAPAAPPTLVTPASAATPPTPATP